MSLDILKTRVKENKLSGLFMFCGPEEYTKDYYVSRIRKTVDSSPLPEFNHIFFNASRDSISDLEDAVYSLPYMWETKLIEITDIESAALTESDIEDYARIFSEIPDYLTVLCVLRSSEAVDKKLNAEPKKDADGNEIVPKGGLKVFKKTVAEFGLVVEFENERADKLSTWIIRHFNAKGVEFEPNVPKEILNTCGTDMYILQGEIEKLSIVYDGKPLKASDVRKYCCMNSDYKYFDIANALNRRDIVTAKRIFDSLDLSREELGLAVGFLAKNYAQMLHAKTAIDSGKGHDVLAKDLKKSLWAVKNIAASVSNIDVGLLSYAITQLSVADMKLKSYSGDPWKILELAFYRICSYGRKA